MKRKQKPWKFEVEVVREMTPAEHDAFVALLFEWLKRDLEAGELSDEPNRQAGLGSQD